MIRALLDQGLPERAARMLRDEGWDVIHVREIMMATPTTRGFLSTQPTPQILSMRGSNLPSAILIRQERLCAHAAAALLKALWSRYEQDLQNGCILSVGRHGTRVRPLPIPRSGT